jgi:hypothetical protein
MFDQFHSNSDCPKMGQCAQQNRKFYAAISPLFHLPVQSQPKPIQYRANFVHSSLFYAAIDALPLHPAIPLQNANDDEGKTMDGCGGHFGWANNGMQSFFQSTNGIAAFVKKKFAKKKEE